MDKPFNSPLSNTPAVNNTNRSVGAQNTNPNALSRQSIERVSFENALDRIRAQESTTSEASQSDLENKAAEAHDSEASAGVNAQANMQGYAQAASTELNTPGIASESELDALDALGEDAQESNSQSTHSLADQNQSSVVDALRDLTHSPDQISIEGLGMESMSANDAGTLGTTVGDSAGHSAPGPSSGSLAHWESARVSELMKSLETMPGTESNIWHFGVLDHASGVVALQIERAQNGAWRLNIEFNDDGLENAQSSTQELRDALIHEGHDVESIQVSSEHPALPSSHD